MSRWFPDHLAVVIEPGRLVFERSAGADRRCWNKIFEVGDGVVPAWTQALAVLAAELGSLSTPHVLDLTLHSSMVRYAVVPWHQEFVSGADRRALVEHTFVQLFGEVARSWTLRSSDTRFGVPALAAGIERVLLDALQQLCAGTNHRLGSVQPDLVAGFNRACSQLQEESFWFVLIDTNSYVLLLNLDGVHRVVQVAGRSEGSIGMLLDRAWLALAEDHPRCTVYAMTTGTTIAEIHPGQWKMQWLAPPLATGPRIVKPKTLAVGVS